MVFPVSCVAISDMGEMSLKLFGGAAEAHFSDQACVVHSNTRMSIVVMLTAPKSGEHFASSTGAGIIILFTPQIKEIEIWSGERVFLSIYLFFS